MSAAVNKNSNKNINNSILFLKRNYADVRTGRKDIVQQWLNQEISWQIFPTIV